MTVIPFLVFLVGFISAVQGYLHIPGMKKLPTPVDHLLRGGPGKQNLGKDQNEASWDDFPETGMGWFWHDIGPNSAKKTTTTSNTKSLKNMDVIPHGKVGRSYHFDYVPRNMDSLSIWDEESPVDIMPKGKISHWSDSPVENIPKGKVSHWNGGPVNNIPKGKISHWNSSPENNMPKGEISHWNGSPENNIPRGELSHWNGSPENNMPNSDISHWNGSPENNMPNGEISHWNGSPKDNRLQGKVNSFNNIPDKKASGWRSFPKANSDEWDDIMTKEKDTAWSTKNTMSDDWSEIPQGRRVKVYSKQQVLSKTPPDEEERIGPQEDRIVGGRDVQDGEVPWQVSLQRRSMRTGKIYHICGGSIINKEWILTAAHCVALALMSNYRVVSGTSELADENRIKGRSYSFTIHKVVDTHIHHAYDMFRFRNDIALVKVSPAFDIGGSVSAISLPSPGSEFGGQAVASGWGLMQEGVRVTPSRLQTVVLPLWTDDKCKEVYGDNVANTMICAGYEQGGKSVCQGDSGGPLFKGSGSGATLIGVVSWGVGCARPGKPGVYTEVSHYINWIDRITGRH